MSERRCKTCGRPLPEREANPFDPFCSKRCSLVDLGRWFDEDYRIPVRRDESDEEGDGGLPASGFEDEELH